MKISIYDRNADITLLIAPLLEIVTMCIYSGAALNKRCELTIATPASHCRYAASKIRQMFLKKCTWIWGKHPSISNYFSKYFAIQYNKKWCSLALHKLLIYDWTLPFVVQWLLPQNVILGSCPISASKIVARALLSFSRMSLWILNQESRPF